MRRILFLAIFSALMIGVIYWFNIPKEKPLPFINPVDLDSSMVDPELLRLGRGHTIGSFQLRNQDNKVITRDIMNGKVVVAEYFFSTCQTICPRMNEQMQRIHAAYRDDSQVHILSFTVDPETDTPEQLRTYAREHDALNSNWDFLTGSRQDIYELARKSFFLLKPAEAENQGDVGSDFIHTNNFVLVDPKGRIRGYYDGTNPKEVDGLIHDIQLLKNE